MTSGDVLKLFRAEMADAVQPYLWSDVDVYTYIDDAQKMYCRNTDGISDATTAAVTTLSVTPGTTWLATHPSILKIRGLTRTDTGRPVDVVNFEDMAANGWYYNGTTGVLKALVVGQEIDKARVYPNASETVTLALLVFRMPLGDIFGDQDFEIPAKHHRHLLLWVKSLAYGKHDAETYDKGRSDDFAAKFEAYCAKAKIEERRARHKPRTVAYGGI